MPVIGQFLWPRRPLSEVFGNGLGPKRSVHFSSASRSENTLLPFPTHDNHGLQGSIMLVSQVDEGNAIGRDREAIFLEDVEDEIEALDPVDTCLGRRTSFGGLLAPLVRTGPGDSASSARQKSLQ